MRKDIIKQEFTASISANLPFEPTPDQHIAIDRLGNFITSVSQFEIFVLTGYAGTGKTTLMASFVKSLADFKLKSVLLAPTGRAAKVLSNYSGKRASTIHRKIYFISSEGDGIPKFRMSENKHTNTVFIVDEASMVTTNSGMLTKDSFGQKDLLEDLLQYVYSGENCKLIFVGDRGQLPPVGMSASPALDIDFLKKSYSFDIVQANLENIVRQEEASGILEIATQLRRFTEEIPRLNYNTTDARSISGLELQDELESAIHNYGNDNVMVVCRSNKRANLFNQQIRRRVHWQEEEIEAGDVMMAVHNNYFWLDPKSEAGFIANGEMFEILKIIRREDIFGFRFADVLIRFIDYPNMKEVEIKIMLDAIHVESANLPREKLKELFYRIGEEEYGDIRNKRKRTKLIMENPYFQAIQVKFGYAVTCHKAQGGQWPAVFIDHGYFVEDMWNEDYMRWLYTAVTRASIQLFLVNFDRKFVGEIE